MSSQRILAQTPKSPFMVSPGQSSTATASPNSRQTYAEAASTAKAENIPDKVLSLKEKVMLRFQTKLSGIRAQQKLNVVPYYADARTNTFSILEDESAVIEDDGYNAAAVQFITEQSKGTLSYFRDEGVTSEARVVLDSFSHYIRDVRAGGWDATVENLDKPEARLFKLANMVLANLYWRDRTKVQHVLVPSQTLKAFTDGKGRVTKQEFVNYERLLKLELMRYNMGPLKERMANAFIHLLKLAWESPQLPQERDACLKLFIASHKKYTPTLTMLRVNGLVPDVKVGSYKDLFLQSEWEVLSSFSNLGLAEQKLNKALKRGITHENVTSVIETLRQISADVNKDPLSAAVRQIRRDRLREAGRLKALVKKGKVSLSSNVSRHLADRRVQEAFNPFRIHFEAKRIKATPSELFPFVKYDKEKDIYFWGLETPKVPTETDRLIEAIGLEFSEWLNRT